MNLWDYVAALCTKKLADVLFHNVDCSHEDRATVDWLTAEAFVVKNPGAVDVVCLRFVARSALLGQDFRKVAIWDVPVDLRYEAFDRLCGRIVWDLLYQKIRRKFPSNLYPNIRFG